MKIENYREQPQTSREIARFDVYLDAINLTLREFRIVRKKDGKGWFIAAPAFKKTQGDKDTWIPYFEWSEAKSKMFFDKLHELVKQVIEQATS
jgi:hypothetical protein